MNYDNLTDDEILDKMAEVDYDIWKTEQELKKLRNLYSQTLQQESPLFSATRAAYRRNR